MGPKRAWRLGGLRLIRKVRALPDPKARIRQACDKMIDAPRGLIFGYSARMIHASLVR
jgi:hypothetical protein